MADVDIKRVVIYTDGAAEPNPGPGGYGAVLLFGKHRREISGGYRRTTNNRMELTGAIKALEALKNLCEVTLYSDSKYVVEAMTQGWVEKWKSKEFLKKGRLMTNADLWKRLVELCELHKVRFEWVKGHAGDVENERCDALAMAALLEKDLPDDEGYEEQLQFAEEAAAGALFSDTDDPPFPKSGKVMQEGDPCRKCNTPLEKRIPKKRGKGAYYYAWYLACPACGTNYILEEAKRYN